jgi:hypothetical protein
MTEEASQTLFRSEYELELEAWLRRRFGYLCIAYLVWELLLLFVIFIGAALAALGRASFMPATSWHITAIIGSIECTAYLAVICFFYFRRRHTLETREELARAAGHMILALGAISLLAQVAAYLFAPSLTSNFLVDLFLWHVTACLFLPWRPVESLRATVPLLVVWATATLLLPSDSGMLERVLQVAFSPSILLLGLAICAIRLQRHRQRFRAAMVGRHFMTMRRELSQARALHESMFPRPHDDGFIRFEYSYSPARELGGDFVHVHIGGEGMLHLALIDVTGHGLSAALTVSRLYGELERIRAESPNAEPDEVLRLINHYIHLTMLRHGIFATAIALMIDPYAGKLRWANAGHPPGYRRTVNGAVDALASQGVLLGALPSNEFDIACGELDLAPDDIVLLYTDGVMEARGRDGGMFGLTRLRELLQRHPAPQHWPQFVAAQVGKFSGGRSSDDVLVASVALVKVRAKVASTRPLVATH